MFVAPWLLGFADQYDNLPYRDFMFCLPFGQLFVVAPSMYVYVQSLLKTVFKF